METWSRFVTGYDAQDLRTRVHEIVSMSFARHRSSALPRQAIASGQAMAALEEVAKQTLPPEIGYDWADLSYQERKASGTTTIVFAISLVFVFLILAALYESWSLPFSVLLTVPVAVFGAFLGVWLRRLRPWCLCPDRADRVDWPRSEKNAILIVEFAKAELEKGRDLIDAALEGARLRLRPILMTSFAFILGSAPLWTRFGGGRGSTPHSRHSRDRRNAGRNHHRDLF